jgi:4-hydroxythreonine-4-phosphate dehydrogenase
MAPAPEPRPLTVGIALGDVTGIGPEITVAALQAESTADDTRYVVLGDAPTIRASLDRLGWDPGFRRLTMAEAGDRFLLHEQPLRMPLPASMPSGAAPAAKAALAWLTEGAQLCLTGQLDALVTAPLSKAAILRTGRAFTGQTEFLTELAGNPPTAMMLLGHDDRDRWLRVTLVTTHLPLRDVADAITPGKIELAVRLSVAACADLGLARARIGVCGLNPHAGEEGLLGDEEVRLIIPVVERLRAEGFDVSRPVAGDTIFHAAAHGQYDAVVAMYHDQGLAPLKLLAFHTGVNWTLGLPFIRTSPDHGPAYDIVGSGRANPSSMQAAIRLARKLARRRGGMADPHGL